MKRLIVSGLSLLLVLATTAPALKATATLSPQIHTATANTIYTPAVSPWLLRVNATRASQVVTVKPTSISTATISTHSIPAVSPWLVRVNQTRGSLHTIATAGNTAQFSANSATSDQIVMFDRYDGR